MVWMARGSTSTNSLQAVREFLSDEILSEKNKYISTLLM
jgi:hypothetical protein